MKMSKLKWKWIKFWGHRYIWMYPNKANKQVVISMLNKELDINTISEYTELDIDTINKIKQEWLEKSKK